MSWVYLRSDRVERRKGQINASHWWTVDRMGKYKCLWIMYYYVYDDYFVQNRNHKQFSASIQLANRQTAFLGCDEIAEWPHNYNQCSVSFLLKDFSSRVGRSPLRYSCTRQPHSLMGIIIISLIRIIGKCGIDCRSAIRQAMIGLNGGNTSATNGEREGRDVHWGLCSVLNYHHCTYTRCEITYHFISLIVSTLKGKS